MDKKVILGIIVIIIIGAIFMIYKKPSNISSEKILFYGSTCPHCKNVEKFINDNNIKSKIAFQELEVYENIANQKILGEKAKICGMDTNNIGVPMFWDGKTCITGDQPIINYLQEQTK
jgi:glutaredoxin